MKKKRVGFKILCAVTIILAVLVIAYASYEIFVLKIVDSKRIFRAVVILASLSITMVRLFMGNSKGKIPANVFRGQYYHIIGDAFKYDSKTEKLFFEAVNLRNQNESQKALKRFEEMVPLCQRNDERFAVAFFMGLCYKDMGVYIKAVELYEKALTYHENSTAASNLAGAFECLGKFEDAISAYLWAIKIDPDNAYPYNNIAQLYIKMDAYEDAIEYAVKASELKADMYQAWSAQAICYAMMEYMEDYEIAYRRAVACGADGDMIKRFIRSLGADI